MRTCHSGWQLLLHTQTHAGNAEQLNEKRSFFNSNLHLHCTSGQSRLTFMRQVPDGGARYRIGKLEEPKKITRRQNLGKFGQAKCSSLQHIPNQLGYYHLIIGTFEYNVWHRRHQQIMFRSPNWVLLQKLRVAYAQLSQHCIFFFL